MGEGAVIKQQVVGKPKAVQLDFMPGSRRGYR